MTSATGWSRDERRTRPRLLPPATASGAVWPTCACLRCRWSTSAPRPVSTRSASGRRRSSRGSACRPCRSASSTPSRRPSPSSPWFCGPGIRTGPTSDLARRRRLPRRRRGPRLAGSAGSVIVRRRRAGARQRRHQLGQAAALGMPTMFLSGSAAAAGIATINSIGNLGGFVGPAMIGWIKDQTGSFPGGCISSRACSSCPRSHPGTVALEAVGASVGSSSLRPLSIRLSG